LFDIPTSFLGLLGVQSLKEVQNEEVPAPLSSLQNNLGLFNTAPMINVPINDGLYNAFVL